MTNKRFAYKAVENLRFQKKNVPLFLKINNKKAKFIISEFIFLYFCSISNLKLTN